LLKITGAEGILDTVKVNTCVAIGSTPLDAIKEIVTEPAVPAVGVPDKMLLLKCNQEGKSDKRVVRVGVGKPAVVI